MDEFGAVQFFCLCDRRERKGRVNTSTSGYDFSRLVPASEMIFKGNYFRHDQNRGVSPLASSLNLFQDVKEIDEYQLIKCKKHAMFGLMLKSDGTGATGFNEEAVETEDSESNTITEYLNELRAGIKIEGGAEDDVNMFESKNPSTEYQQFSEMMLRKAIAALGIPYTFWDSRKSSYSAQKQDRAEFSLAVKNFRDLMAETLYDISSWVVPKLIREYGLKVPSGQRLKYEWIPQGEPWLNEGDEVQAAGLRIAYGLSSRQHECKKKGLDFFDVARELSTEENYIDKAGLHVAIGQPGQTVSNENENNISTKEASDG
jgi:Bacteriophage capsid protein